jgi:hypothetical protein
VDLLVADVMLTRGQPDALNLARELKQRVSGPADYPDDGVIPI